MYLEYFRLSHLSISMGQSPPMLWDLAIGSGCGFSRALGTSIHADFLCSP